jgi:3-oxoacyl-[acyl-carrier-protein] synthase III
VRALVQALDWFEHGSKKGVIVCSETFSKFTRPETLQMAASIGDGAVAMQVSRSDAWKVRGVVHGTDPAYMKNMYVPGKYPVRIDAYNPLDYVFHFEDKPDTLKKMAEYWVGSLQDLLKTSGVVGSAVSHYFAHQVDGSKNPEIARACGIEDPAIARNFAGYGNMGCPTIFLNYERWKAAGPKPFKTGDIQVFHAVGGGLSWAGICLERT